MRRRLLGKLQRQLDSCKHRYVTVEDISAYLRSIDDEYARMNLQQFTRMVRQTLESSPNKKRKNSPNPNKPQNQRQVQPLTPQPVRLLDIHSDDEEEELNRVNLSRKKMKKLDRSEERLKRIENMHVSQRRNQNSRNDDTDDSSESLGESEDGDGEEGTVSTSEDAIYEEKVEPAFDITKLGLRKMYTEANSTKSSAKLKKEKNIELEMSTDKRKKKIEVGIGSESKGEGKNSSSGVGSGLSDNVLVKGNEGPRFRDLGGMKEVLEELKMEVIVPLYHPELPKIIGIRPMAGILLHGPPGCGKTRLAQAIANETNVPFYMISATEIVSGVSGASEENIRELFQKAYRTAPSIVFIDEIDAIASKRENLQREMERRIVTQLMTCMDESHRQVKATDKNAESQNSGSNKGFVLVIGATNRPDAVDPALRRPGRFDREIVLGVPDENARFEILSVLTKNLKLEGTFDLMKIARWTPGFVGADLKALADKAGRLAMRRIVDSRKAEMSRSAINEEDAEEWWRQPWMPEEIEKLSVTMAITMADFEEAAKMVQPSSRREGFSAIPNVTWEDVGGLDSLRQAFDRYIVRRIKYPEEYEEFGVDLETGFLLFGPPGCGKTLIAKAVANEAGANFIHIKGPELLNKYVGESELAIRTLFTRARTCSPCVLFFDEVDALTKQRGTEGGWVVERLLNQLLIELDGADHRRGVFVIGATNRIEAMDTAILRPGRFGKLHYVRLPTEHERGLILKALSRKKPIDPDVDLHAIARTEACENLSGADLAALINEAAMVALEEKLTSGDSVRASSSTIKTLHFEKALAKISPSVSKTDLQMYEKLAKDLKAAS